MAKTTARYRCSACGALHPRWSGRCDECGAWNTIVEETPVPGSQRRRISTKDLPRPVPLTEIREEALVRHPTGSKEFDRVLGGGLVPGSIVLLGGDPGIGKSTLLLQVTAHLARSVPTLYVSGEESLGQIALRARRLATVPPEQGFGILAETSLETILAVLAQERPRVVVIDSIQTVMSENLESAPGSVSQLRECAAALVRWAKREGAAVFLVGHVTREGTIAGPRVLEHLVDAVLYFESETSSRYRMVRAVKNRFGAVHEVGLFVMMEGGLREVTNPSAIFLSRHGSPVSGSAVGVVHEGTRPLLVEVQALVEGEEREVPPRRVALGIEGARLVMLLAVAQRHLGLATGSRDVFVNLVGGLRSEETALDLPVLLAILSSVANRPLPEGLAAFGEIGLAGEIRPVPYGIERAAEAAKQGHGLVLLPRDNLPRKGQASGVNAIGVSDCQELVEVLATKGWSWSKGRKGGVPGDRGKRGD